MDQSVRLEAGDQEGVQRLIQYFLRCPFSQARMIRLGPGRATAGQVEVTEAGKGISKAEHHAVGRFVTRSDIPLASDGGGTAAWHPRGRPKSGEGIEQCDAGQPEIGNVARDNGQFVLQRSGGNH